MFPSSCAVVPLKPKQIWWGGKEENIGMRQVLSVQALAMGPWPGTVADLYLQR